MYRFSISLLFPYSILRFAPPFRLSCFVFNLGPNELRSSSSLLLSLPYSTTLHECSLHVLIPRDNPQISASCVQFPTRPSAGDAGFRGNMHESRTKLFFFSTPIHCHHQRWATPVYRWFILFHRYSCLRSCLPHPSFPLIQFSTSILCVPSYLQ